MRSRSSMSAATARYDAGANGRAASGGLLEVLPAGPPPADAADLLEVAGHGRAPRRAAGPRRHRAHRCAADAARHRRHDARREGGRRDRRRPRPAREPAAHGRSGPRARRVRGADRSGSSSPASRCRRRTSTAATSGSAEPACRRHGRRPESANCCESRARLLVGRPPHPASPVEAVVGEARTHLGDLRPARRPVAARGRGRRLGLSPDDAKLAKRDAKPHARHADAARATGPTWSCPTVRASRSRSSSSPGSCRIKTVYLEVYDRIDSATLTGRLCRPLSSLFLVQWEEQQRLYPGARVIGGLF